MYLNSVILLLPLFRHRKMRASRPKLARIRSFDLPNQIAVSFITSLRFVLLAELEKLSKRKSILS